MRQKRLATLMQDKDTGACGASAPRLDGMESIMRVGDISRSAQEKIANAWGTWDNLFTEYQGKDDGGNPIKQIRLRYPVEAEPTATEYWLLSTRYTN